MFFLAELRKNNVYPCKPQFYYIKMGFKGVKIIQACFRDGKKKHPKKTFSNKYRIAVHSEPRKKIDSLEKYRYIGETMLVDTFLLSIIYLTRKVIVCFCIRI